MLGEVCLLATGTDTRHAMTNGALSLIGRHLRKTALADQIAAYGDLEDDWDDQGGRAATERTVALARAVATVLADEGLPPTRTYATGEGEIGLVWVRGKGYADVSVNDEATFSYYVRDASGAEE